MGLHRTAGHFKLFGNFGVITALQKQFDDLFFARPQANRLLPRHFRHSLVGLGSLPEIQLC
jgi:hypothetical protein